MLTVDSKLQIDENFKSKVEDLVSDILIKSHGNGPRTKVKKMHNRLNFACPYCGDGSNDALKKRGNLFWDTLYYHCYNYGCGSHKSLNDFINDFTPGGLDSSERIAVFDYIKNNVKKTSRQNLKHEMFEKLYGLAVPISTFMERTKSKLIKKDSPGFEYLAGRLLTRSSSEFTYGSGKLYILNMTNDGKHVIGFQIRNLTRSSAKYLTYNIEKMYNFCGLDISNQEEIEKLNDISTLFGVLNIDFTRSVTVFEGPLDAKFMNNSIALCTVGRSVEQFTDIPTIRYMFDNDQSGKKAMMSLLKTGKEVFLWSKFIKENKLQEYKIKDMNDLVLICYKNKLSAYKYINNYFSSNTLDSFYV